MSDFIFAYLESIIRPKDNKEFKIGDLVYWNDPDYVYEMKEYQDQYGSIFEGNIGQIYLIHYQWDKPDVFHIEIGLNNEKPFPLGRLDLNDIEHNIEDIEDYYHAGQLSEMIKEVEQ